MVQHSSNIKIRDMKNNKLTTFLMAFAAVLFIGQVSYAQFDDLYYEPSESSTYVGYDEYDSEEYDDADFDDAEYESYDWEEDEYIYTKKINRFDRTSRNLGYYGSYYNSGFGYSDFGYFNRNLPISRFGGNTLIFTSGSRNAFNVGGFNNSPFIGVNNRGFGGNQFGFNRGFGGNSFGGFNSFNNSFGGAAYCPPSYYSTNRRGISAGNIINGRNNTVNNASGRASVNSSRNSGTTSRSVSNSPRNQTSSARTTTPRSRTNANTSTTRRSPRSASSTRTSKRNTSARSNTRSSTRSARPSTRSNSRSTRSYRPSSTTRSSSTRSSTRSSSPRSSRSSRN